MPARYRFDREGTEHSKKGSVPSVSNGYQPKTRTRQVKTKILFNTAKISKIFIRPATV